MGTHPIFESDFDCLTDSDTKIQKTWSERETTSWPTPISTRTGKEESRPGSTNQPERLEDQQTELQRTLLLLLAQLVDSSAQLFIAQLKDTTCVLELAKVSPQLKSRLLDGLSVKLANSVSPLISREEIDLLKDFKLMSKESRNTDPSLSSSQPRTERLDHPPKNVPAPPKPLTFQSDKTSSSEKWTHQEPSPTKKRSTLFSKLSVWPVPTRNWLVEGPSAHAKPPRLPNKLPQKRNKSDLWESYKKKKKKLPGGKNKKKKKKKKKKKS